MIPVYTIKADKNGQSSGSNSISFMSDETAAFSWRRTLRSS
jgi:hypothetical protein